MNEIPQTDGPVWRPFRAQVPFLASSATEALYGGAAGGGKTDALVLGALRWVARPTYTAIIFRRTFPELEGKLIPVSQAWYPCVGGAYNAAKHTWRFPSGARVMFAHMQHEDDAYQYQGHEFQYIGFDELTHFTEKQYTYLLTRLRSTVDIPRVARAGTNPGGPGHEWVQKRWAPWLDGSLEYEGPRAKPGEVLRYDNTKDGTVWSERGRFSRAFFPAFAKDNPYLNDDYVDMLMGQDAVTRAQLIEGDWMIRPSAGLYFKRAWFTVADRIDEREVVTRVRRWDLASTEGGGDWTVGVLMARTRGGKYIVEDVIRGRWRPEGVQRAVVGAAERDGRTCRIVIPQDPGQAGVAQTEWYAKLLAGYNVRFERETGDKVTRAQPLSAQAEARNVVVLRAPWNDVFFQTLEAFPEEGVHDDDVDAAAGAFNALTETPASLGDAAFKSPTYRAVMPPEDDGWGDDRFTVRRTF